VILSQLPLRSARYYSASLAVLYLCAGLMLWSVPGPSKSVLLACLKWGLSVCAGVGFLVYVFFALKDYRKAKRKGMPELQVKE
jgi:hypothetical protein